MTPRPENKSEYDALVLATAIGQKTSAWCKETGVAQSTASAWKASPEFRAAVEAEQKEMLTRARSRLAAGAELAATTMLNMAHSAISEPTKLAAANSILRNLVEMTDFVEIRDRLEALEAKEKARAGEHLHIKTA